MPFGIDIKGLATFGSIWLLCAIVAGVVASGKGRRFWVWFPFGILTGPLALSLALRAFEVVPADEAQICPNCHRAIRKTFRQCPRCHHVIDPEPDRAQMAGRQAAAAVFLLRRAAQRSTAAVKAEQAKRKALRDQRSSSPPE